MPAHRLNMRLVKEVLRLKFAASLSHRQIAAALHIGIGTVSNYLAAFERSGLTFPLPPELDETELGRLLFRLPYQLRRRLSPCRTLPTFTISCGLKV